MRLINPGAVKLINHEAHTVHFEGARGERLRLDVLDHDLIRVCHWPDGAPRLDRTWTIVGRDGTVPREGRRRTDLSPFACPPYRIRQHPATVQVETDALRMDITLDDFGIVWAERDGREIASDLPRRAYSYDLQSQSIYHYLRRRSGERYYGLGEASGLLDKADRRVRLANTDALSYNAETSNPLYKHIPFYITLLPESNIAYGLFYDNLAETVFDLGQEINAVWGTYRYYQALMGDLDYYFIYGPTVADVVMKFTRLTGLPALMPRWSLGYLGSTMYYTERADADAQLAGFTAKCHEHDIPCDMFHLSSGYTTDAQGNRCVFTWNRSRIPDPAATIARFSDVGIHVAANVKPHLLAVHPYYNDVAAAQGFIQNADSDMPATIYRWSGNVFESAPGAFVDFTSDAGFNWWKARVTESLLDYGIDCIWNDNNEFDSTDDSARCAGSGEMMPLGMVRSLQTLLMGQASYEAMQEARPGLRPYVLTRAGSPGIQRHAQTWSGDNATSWHTLRYNIPMGLGLSLCGLSNTGHDVGGFAGERPDPELFIRWIQNGIFHPRFTIHSIGDEGEVNEPWMYPDVLPLVREAFMFRYRLIPYLYILAFNASQCGEPIIRPLVYQFQHDPLCHAESFDFMLGPNLLVASVLEAGARSRAVYLPAGMDWYDFHNGALYAGGQTVTVAAPLERIPLFVPAGGMIPTGKPMRHTGEQADDLRRVYVFPHAVSGKGIFTLVEDDGVTTAYRDGVMTSVTMKAEADTDHIRLQVLPPEGCFPLPYSEIEFVLPQGESRPVEADGGVERMESNGRRSIIVPLPQR